MIISVIIPVYNVEQYLGCCLDSIINQSYRKLDIILVDDASSDNSGRICDEYARLDSRIRVFHNSHNKGVVYTRSRGFQYAEGNYISCIDADDWVDLNTYQEIVRIIEKSRPDMVSYGYYKDYNGLLEEKKEYLTAGLYTKASLKEMVRIKRPFYTPFILGSLCTKVIKTELVQKFDAEIPRDMTVLEDATLTYICLQGIQNLYVIDRCFYHRRDRKESASFLWKNDNYQSCVKGIKILIREANKQENLVKEYKDALLNYIIFQLLASSPDKIFSEKNLEMGLLFPMMTKGSRIVIYGKGHIGSKLYNIMQRSSCFEVVSWIDQSDNYKLLEINENKYDYILIAVGYAEVLINIKHKLYKLGVQEKKILSLSDIEISTEILPHDIKNLFYSIPK